MLSSFITLMLACLSNHMTILDEIFGPLSLRALEKDQYVRCIEGFLPTSTVAFLDGKCCEREIVMQLFLLLI